MASTVVKDRKEYRIWNVVDKVWHRLNFLTNANSVDAADGKNLQTKVGAIDGITSDVNGESDRIAASIKCVNRLKNNHLGGFTPVIDSTGKITGYKTKVGADTVFPFSDFSSATVDYVFGILNETVANSVRTLNFGNKQKYIDNYKALIFAFGEPGCLYDALIYGDAVGMKIITPEDFAKGKNFSVSWRDIQPPYNSYSVNISYVSNTQVKVTSVLRDNRYGIILGIK